MLSLKKRLELFKGYKRLNKNSRMPFKFYDHSDKMKHEIVYNGVSIARESINDIIIIDQYFMGDKHGDLEINPVLVHLKGRYNNGGMICLYGSLERDAEYITIHGCMVLGENIQGDTLYKLSNDNRYMTLVNTAQYAARRYADRLYNESMAYDYLYTLYEITASIKDCINLLINARNAAIKNNVFLNTFSLHCFQLYRLRRELKEHKRDNEVYIDYTSDNIKSIILECKHCFKLSKI